MEKEMLTIWDLKAAKLIFKTSINPKEIAKAQKVMKAYKLQEEKKGIELCEKE